MFTPISTINPIKGTSKEEEAVLADEEPLEIRLGFMNKHGQRVHKSLAVLLRSPGQDIELCLGYLFSRKIIHSASQVMDIETYKINKIRVELVSNHQPVINKSILDLQLKSIPNLKTEGIGKDDFQIRAEYLCNLAKNLRLKQDLFHSTGSTSACGLFDEYGVVLQIAEDLRIQNALDKLLGSLLLKDKLPLRKQGLIISTGADFELLHRALQIYCPMLASLGAPSSLAVEMARQSGMSLLALLHEEAFSIYHDSARIIA
jgi:FdhD protein